MQRSYRRVKIWFRILGLSKKQIARFQKEVKSSRHEWKMSYLRDEPSVSVVKFELKYRQRYDDLLAFLQVNKPKKTTYGIWVSLVTDNDTGGVHVPSYVVRLHEKTGGTLDFSFTSV